MHRTDVFGARSGRRLSYIVMLLMRPAACEPLRGSLEFLLTPCAAKAISLSFEGLVMRTIWLDRHSTHRVVLFTVLIVRMVSLMPVVVAGRIVHAIYFLSLSLETRVGLEWPPWL